MDEILKAKRLREEILKRAASIQEHMLNVNQRMANMQLMEKKAPKASEPTTRLLDLSTDNLQQLLGILGAQGDYKSLCCLSRTCKAMLQLVITDGPCWEVLGRRHWKVRETDPHSAPRMDTCLLDGLPGFCSSADPLNPVHEDLPIPQKHEHVACASSTSDQQAQGPRPGHRASDPVGTSARPGSLNLCAASGSSRIAALALRQQQQGDAYSPREHRSPGSAASVCMSEAASASASSEVIPCGGLGCVGGHNGRGGATEYAGSRQGATGCSIGPGMRPVPPWFEKESEVGVATERSRASDAGSPSSSAPLLRSTSSSSSKCYLSSQGPDKAAVSATPIAKLCRFGSVGTATSRTTGDPLLALRSSLSMNGWHGSISCSSSSSSRRATYNGDLLGLGTRRTGVMLAAGANVWRQIVKDRVQGWRLVIEMLEWLQHHGHPTTVSGSNHRLQQLIALRYLKLFTQHPEDMGWRQSMIKLDCLKSLLALVDNENGAVVEMALHVLSNHVLGDHNLKAAVNIGTRLGKALLGKLDANEKQPSIVREASRLLATLWSEDPCPEVVTLTSTNTPAKPDLCPGLWYLHEFSSRGESLRLLEVYLTFEEQFGTSSIDVNGDGHEPQATYAEDSFRIMGSISAAGAWSLQRCLQQVTTIMYEGYSDAWGAWGVYRGAQRTGPTAFEGMLSRGRQPRVFRLFRKRDLEDSSDDDGHMHSNYQGYQ